jgi:pilus assembly protein CpaE
MANLEILIVESDALLRQSLSGQIEGLTGFSVAGTADDLVAAQRLVTQLRPDVLLLELDGTAGDALELAERVRVEQPHVLVLGTTASVRPELMRQAMRCGIQDLLSRPVEPGHLKTALDHAAALQARRERSQERRGHVTAVIGVSGGVGTTTVATNIAVELARDDDSGSVALADLDLVSGSVPCFLDLRPERTFQDLLAESDRLDGEQLRQMLPRHRSGLYMLAGPQSIEDLDAVSQDDVRRAIELCRSAFRRVVVDGGHGLDERRFEMLERVDEVLLVLQPSVAALHRARRTLETLARLGFPAEQIRLVLNRVERGADVGPKEVREGLGRPVTYMIPSDYRTVIAAIDNGQPLIEAKRSNRLTDSLRAIATDLARGETGPATGDTTDTENQPATQAGSGGPITRLFSGLQRSRSSRQNGSGSNGNGSNGNGSNGNGRHDARRAGSAPRTAERPVSG